MNPRIEHPTDRPNFTLVYIDGLKLAFSYSTVVGFSKAWEPWKVRGNDWGPTTGKHLNSLNDRKEDRIPSEQFERMLDQYQIRLITNPNLR